jgi:hypothetical protein
LRDASFIYLLLVPPGTKTKHPPNAFTRAPHHISALSALQALSVTMISSSNPLTCSGDAGKLYFHCARRARKEHIRSRCSAVFSRRWASGGQMYRAGTAGTFKVRV